MARSSTITRFVNVYLRTSYVARTRSSVSFVFCSRSLPRARSIVTAGVWLMTAMAADATSVSSRVMTILERHVGRRLPLDRDAVRGVLAREAGLSTAASLLRTLEQPAVDRLAEDVALHRLHHVRARLEGVGGRLHVELRVERVD